MKRARRNVVRTETPRVPESISGRKSVSIGRTITALLATRVKLSTVAYDEDARCTKRVYCCEFANEDLGWSRIRHYAWSFMFHMLCRNAKNYQGIEELNALVRTKELGPKASHNGAQMARPSKSRKVSGDEYTNLRLKIPTQDQTTAGPTVATLVVNTVPWEALNNHKVKPAQVQNNLLSSLQAMTGQTKCLLSQVQRVTL